IFLETHSELETLTDELNELYEVYQMINLKDDSDSDDDDDCGMGNKSKSILSEEGQKGDVNDNIIFEEGQENDVNDVFTLRQVEEFKKIYTLKPIQASIKKENKSLIKLEKQDNELFLKKLQNSCCQKHCITKINTQEALKCYCEIKALSQSESNFCFLGMLDASARFGTLNNVVMKTYLTTNYQFMEHQFVKLLG
ncbi:33341_t:CDS:1, partial [Gigaspora margarita]